jgi:hypothetical protein
VAEVSTPGQSLGGDSGAIYAVLLDRPVRTLRADARTGSAAIMAAVERWDVERVIARERGPWSEFFRDLERGGWRLCRFGSYAVAERPARAGGHGTP